MNPIRKFVGSPAALAFVGLVFLSSCPGIGDEPLHEMQSLSFSDSAIPACDSTKRSFTFKNMTNQETVILGAAITGGTDPEGNFKLVSVQYGADEKKPGAGGFLNDIHIPPSVDYTFNLSYTPKSENKTHKALFDIVFQAPQEGVVQVELSGASGPKGTACTTTQGGRDKKGKVALSGDMEITIKRIALVSSALSLQPISTDPKDTITAFKEVTVPVKFDATKHTVLLPAIPESKQFLLPRTKEPPLRDLIVDFTRVTSTADASGTWDEDGSLTVKDLPIRLKEKFEADFVVTLTTGLLDIPEVFTPAVLTAGGFSVTNGKIVGTPVDPETFETELIGISSFKKLGGTGTIAGSIGGTKGVVIIKAKIAPPKK